jgi:2-keto-3-deoxy-L-rhamnonate aldolase RhmA
MGIPGDLDHPMMVKALERLRDACRRYHVAAGLHIVHFSEERLSRAVSEGYTLVALGMDNTLLYAAAQDAMETVRSIQSAQESGD